MSYQNRRWWPLIGFVLGLLAIAAVSVYTQDEPQPTNDAPNPYRTTAPWGTLPAGRTWGALRSVKNGKVTAFIPDPIEMKGTSAAEGLAVDAKGNVYGAEVGPQRLARHSKQ